MLLVAALLGPAAAVVVLSTVLIVQKSWVKHGFAVASIVVTAGPSVEMIEKRYGKFIADDGAAPLIRSLRGAKTQTQPQTRHHVESRPCGDESSLAASECQGRPR